MTASSDNGQPTSWRDVYALVRDTREDMLGAIKTVDGKVSKLADRVDAIEDSRAEEKTARETEARLAAVRNRRLIAVVTASRGGIALIVSVGAVLISLFKS